MPSCNEKYIRWKVVDYGYVTLPHISRNKVEWARHWMSCNAHLNHRKWRCYIQLVRFHYVPGSQCMMLKYSWRGVESLLRFFFFNKIYNIWKIWLSIYFFHLQIKNVRFGLDELVVLIMYANIYTWHQYAMSNRYSFIHFHNRWYAVIGLTSLSYRSTIETKFAHIHHNLCVPRLSYIRWKLWILDMLPLKCGIYVALPHISRNKEEWARHWMSCNAHLNQRKWRCSKLGHYNWTYLWTFKELLVGCMFAFVENYM